MMNFLIPGHVVKLEIKDNMLNVRIKISGMVKGKKKILRPKIAIQSKAQHSVFFMHTILSNIEFLKISFKGRDTVMING